MSEVLPLIDGAETLGLARVLAQGFLLVLLLHEVSNVQCIACNCALRNDYAGIQTFKLGMRCSLNPAKPFLACPGCQVVMILRHLLHFNLIRLIPEIHPDCKYRPG